MSASQFLLPRTTRGRRRRKSRRAPGMTREDLLLFEDRQAAGEPGTAGSASTPSRQPAGQSAGDRPAKPFYEQATLTLGGARLEVWVPPEPPAAKRADREPAPAKRGRSPEVAAPVYPELDEDLPLFQGSSEAYDQMATRLSQCRDRRHALQEMLELAEACREAVERRQETASGDRESPQVSPGGDPQTQPSGDRGRPIPGATAVAATQRTIEGSWRVDRPAVRRADPTEPRTPFSWRRMVVTAAWTSGLGCVALLLDHWLVR